MSPFWLQKNLCGKAVGGGPFAADEGHLCTDQAGYHEVGAAEPPPITEATLERTEERGWELIGGGFNCRGSFGLDYFLTFSTGNDINYQ